MEHKRYRVEVYEIDHPAEVETAQFDSPEGAVAYAKARRAEGYSASAIEALEDGSTRLIPDMAYQNRE